MQELFLFIKERTQIFAAAMFFLADTKNYYLGGGKAAGMLMTRLLSVLLRYLTRVEPALYWSDYTRGVASVVHLVEFQTILLLYQCTIVVKTFPEGGDVRVITFAYAI